MTKIKTHKIFPIPVFEFKLENSKKLNEDLLKYIYELKKKNKEGMNKSNVGGWHSPYFQINGNKLLTDFIKQLRQCIIVAFNEFGWEYKDNAVKIDGMWSIINPKNTFNKLHNHPNCYLSAAYYVKTFENCGNIKFFDCKEQKKIRFPNINKYTELSAAAATFKPEEGKLLMFPSYLYHSVDNNETEEERVIISFNVDVDRYANS